jgi:hypothetical protein
VDFSSVDRGLSRTAIPRPVCTWAIVRLSCTVKLCRSRRPKGRFHFAITRAEIRTLAAAPRNAVPVAITYGEEVVRLQSWACGRVCRLIGVGSTSVEAGESAGLAEVFIATTRRSIEWSGCDNTEGGILQIFKPLRIIRTIRRMGLAP